MTNPEPSLLTVPSPSAETEVSPSATQNGRKRNPYVGPWPFRQHDLFFGREREAAGVVNTLLSSRVMLLHSPSGAGKTSLIQASVIPAFAARDFLICATSQPGPGEATLTPLRVNLPPPPELAVENRYVFSVVNGLIGDFTDRHRAAGMTLAESMNEYAAHHPSHQRQLLILDQLEEVLTLDPGDIEGHSQFFQQLGEALDDARAWGLLAIREDYMGGLDRFRQYLPGQLRSTFRLDYLDIRAAGRAIQEPAHAVAVEVDDAAVELLIDELRTVHTGTAVEEGVARRYPYVEPVLLQVVCYSLFEKLSRKQQDKFAAITYADVDEFRPFRKAIRTYYRSVVADVARQNRKVERAMRDWVEYSLISRRGLRRQTRQTPDVPNPEEVLSELRGRYLIHDDPRPGGTPLWELSHDMLVRPIREDNRAWRTRNLAQWQVQAEDWYASDHDKRYLLQASQLRAAPPPRRWPELTETEQAFLQSSDDEMRQSSRLNRLKLQVGLMRLLLGLSLLANVVLVVVFVFVL